MARIDRRIVELGIIASLVGSLALHVGGGVGAFVLEEFLAQKDEPQYFVVEAYYYSEEETTERQGESGREQDQSEAPLNADEAQAAASEEAETQPPPEQAEEPAPQAPYASAPATPAQPQLAEDAQRDETPDEEIREALPRPTVTAAASTALQTPTDNNDDAPTISRGTDRPEDDPCAAASREDEDEDQPRLTAAGEPCPEPADPSEAPDQPEFENQDDQPEASTQPDLEREGGEEVAEQTPQPTPPTPSPAVQRDTVAPQAAPLPVRRPARPRPEPAEEPAAEPAAEVDPLAALEGAVARGSDGFEASDTDGASPFSSRRAGEPLSISEKSSLRFAIIGCWQLPPPGADPEEWTVTIGVDLRRDGTVIGTPTLLEPTGEMTANQRVAARNAVAAIQACAPYPDLPPSKYDEWKSLAVTFDPRDAAPNIE